MTKYPTDTTILHVFDVSIFYRFDDSWPSPWAEIQIRPKGNDHTIKLMGIGARPILAEPRRRKAVVGTGSVI